VPFYNTTEQLSKVNNQALGKDVVYRLPLSICVNYLTTLKSTSFTA